MRVWCPWVHSMKMSSMERSHVRGWRFLGELSSIRFTRAAMNMLAYDGAMHVPMAVPCI